MSRCFRRDSTNVIGYPNTASSGAADAGAGTTETCNFFGKEFNTTTGEKSLNILLVVFIIIILLCNLSYLPSSFFRKKPAYCHPNLKLSLSPSPENKNSTASFSPVVDFSLQNPSFYRKGIALHYDNIIFSLFYKSIRLSISALTNASFPFPIKSLHEQHVLSVADTCDTDVASQYGLGLCRLFTLSARFYMDTHIKGKDGEEIDRRYMSVLCEDLIKVLVSNSSSDSPIVLADYSDNSRKCHAERLTWEADWGDC